MHYTTIAIIYNPNSTGPGKKMAEALKRSLKKRMPDQDVDLISTEYAGHAEELAYTLSKETKKPLIISSSGDGGYHEVINGAMRAQKEGATPYTGLLPAGNANDHYKNLHKKDLAESIANNDYLRIDVLKLKGKVKRKTITRYGHSYIGFGVTPKIGKILNRTKLNFFNQIWIVAKSLITIHSIRLVIKGKLGHYDSVILSNVDKMSKYLKVSRPSKITDGKFEVSIFPRRERLHLILMLIRASVLGIDEDAQVKRFSLKTVRRTLVQIDGEITKLDRKSRVTVTVEQKALRCFI